MSKPNGVFKNGDYKLFAAACSEVLRIAENVSSASETSNDLIVSCLADSVFDKTQRSPNKKEVRRALVFSSSSSPSSVGVEVVSSENEYKEPVTDENEYGKELSPSKVVDYMITLIESTEKEALEEREELSHNRVAGRHAIMNFLYEGSAEYSSIKALGEKLRSIENLNTHLLKIIEEVDLLKVKLQNPVFHNALHINMCYHRFVLEFFQFATALMNELESNKANMDWIQSKNFDCFTMEPLLTNLCDSVIEKQKAIDSLEEFCSSLQKLYDLTRHTSFPIDSCNDADH